MSLFNCLMQIFGLKKSKSKKKKSNIVKLSFGKVLNQKLEEPLPENWEEYLLDKYRKIEFDELPVVCRHYALHFGWVIYDMNIYKEKFDIIFMDMKEDLESILNCNFELKDSYIGVAKTKRGFEIKFLQDSKSMICEFYNNDYYNDDHNIILITNANIIISSESSLLNQERINGLIEFSKKQAKKEN